MTSAHTKLVGLLGSPVAHSLSPAIHTAALEALGIDATYIAFDIDPSALATAVEGLFALGAVGLNVTVPHKRAVLALMEEVEPTARAIGAVNTLVRGERAFVGVNTDAPGFVRSLSEEKVAVAGARAIVLGAGGAARAVTAGLLDAGAAEVLVVARRLDEADGLVRDLAALGPTSAHAWSELGVLAADVDLLVQASSATLGDGDPRSRFASSVPIERLKEHAVVVDIVYRPLETSVLARARQRELQTVDGLGMLVGQAGLSFERWFSRPAPLEIMRRAAAE